jgi:hypothetical protein
MRPRDRVILITVNLPTGDIIAIDENGAAVVDRLPEGWERDDDGQAPQEPDP